MNLSISILRSAVLVMWLSPTLLLVALAIPSVLRLSLRESAVRNLTRVALLCAMTASFVALVIYLAMGMDPQVFSYGAWFSFGADGFAFDFIADGLSLGFALLSIGICGVTSAFSFRYLNLEPGFHRYFVQLAMFVLGMTLVALAGSVEVLFAGWELIGLSSALLVGFFHERRPPVENALRVFAVYRASDAAMLGAAALLHHWAGDGSLGMLFNRTHGELSLEHGQSLVIAILLIIAVAGKSALLPFSGWLPRAMEGPTPSSAVYYGALSIHAGCFLLLRAEPLLAQSLTARVLAVLVGATTALYATMTSRAQTDVKSVLTYASLTQVGIIVVEISLGFTSIAFIHIIGHACFRLLQFLSAPNILHDLHELEDRLGSHLAEPALLANPTYASTRRGWYLAALERGFVDPLVDRVIVAPFCELVGLLDRLDRWLSWSAEEPDRECLHDREGAET